MKIPFVTGIYRGRFMSCLPVKKIEPSLSNVNGRKGKTMRIHKPDSSDNWWPRAACLGLNPDLFFPAGNNETVHPEAAATCARCRVRDPCLEYTLLDPELRGIWAGTTTSERKSIRNARKQAQPDSDRIVWETG